MSRLLAPYRSYCPICTSYRILKRYVTNEYFCAPCTRRITRALLRLHIDPLAQQPDLAAIRSAMDQVVAVLQQTLASEEKVTRWDHQFSVAKWRASPRKCV